MFNPATGRNDACIFPPCRCELRVREEIDARLKRESRNARSISAFPYEPPPKLVDATLDNFDPQTSKQQAAVENFHEYLRVAQHRVDAGQGAYLWGVTGTGKSHCMVAVGNALHQMGYHVVYKDVSQLMLHLKGAAKSYGGLLEGELVKMLGEADVLLLDDLGKETGWDTELNKLHTILNYRVDHLKPTWITSEYSLNDLARHLGRYANGFMSRLMQTVEVFEFDGRDQRGKRRSTWKK